MHAQGLEVVLHQLVITSYACVNQVCPPKTYTKSYEDHSASNIMAFTWERAQERVTRGWPENLADWLLMKHSHPPSKIEEKKKKNYAGSEDTPRIKQGKEDT
eukprot:461213-Pelagomonas_calceolata.AAC.1